MDNLLLVINATPNHEGVLENVQFFFKSSNWSIEGFLFDYLIVQFPAGSKIYVFDRMLKIIKLLIIPLIKRYMTTVVYLITVWRLHYMGLIRALGDVGGGTTSGLNIGTEMSAAKDGSDVGGSLTPL